MDKLSYLVMWSIICWSPLLTRTFPRTHFRLSQLGRPGPLQKSPAQWEYKYLAAGLADEHDRRCTKVGDWQDNADETLIRKESSL